MSSVFDNSVHFGFQVTAVSMNATSPTFLRTYAAVSGLAGLSWTEKLWASYYTWIGNDILATGLLLFTIHEAVYFGRCLPWFIVDRIPYFNRWKIQSAKMPSNQEHWECLKSVLVSHFLMEAVPIWLLHPWVLRAGISCQLPIPPIATVAWQVAMFYVLEDTWHYWTHRAMHYGALYKMIHKKHHRYAAPFGLATEYAHPVEAMVLFFGTAGFPIIFVLLTGNLHLFTVCIWVTGRLLQGVDAHSGYEFPWSLHHFLPFWAGADHHDDHHRYFIGNYASSFRFWDYVMQTESGALAKQDRESKMKGAAEEKAKKSI
ncbi:hypothetical protein BABINDRAFT_163161 [Babjeviella inositovora NRRL Y-12698]|uniref:Fatty acid hydroxylase domain-containing protein n=1 Tax=Babjeviella inositovora NRRL Y-12698 TaxID=984486 RepID=A0A1E3QL03_9ASCO|nr:uncharacterized protein BABINDRAFT_163161 [Babjeviella inositovora NRRL Y-12698]ODQ77762.1 hypothetical protein BABINDRAFT_163161 [Babjeviella inositovora NRRL Y-12698]